MADDDVDDQADVEDDQPPIEDEEMADFGAVADEVEAAAGPDSDDDEDNADQDDAGDQTDDQQADASSTDTDRVTPGDIYCNALGMSAAVARASYGSADPDNRQELVDEYGEMARDLDIDTYVDQWLEEQGGIDELSPGQAILLSTVMWGGMVAMDDPVMLDGLAQEVSQ